MANDIPRAQQALAQFAARVKAGQAPALDAAAAVLKSEIQQQLSSPGRGRFYGRARQRSSVIGPETRAQVNGRRSFNRKLRTYVEALNTGAFDLADVAAKAVKNLHRASSPGDAPAPDTGTLKRSAYIETRGPLVRRVGVATAYALALEFGTTTAGKSRNVVIAPRPFMRPAFAKVRAKIAGLLEAAAGRAGATS